MRSTSKNRTPKDKNRTSTSKSRISKRRWAQDVKTVSTFPPPGTFTKSAEEVARIMASKKVSPRGLGSAVKMVQMFINRSGRNLSAERRKELEEAKKILQHKRREESARN